MVWCTGEGSEARHLLNDREISCQELFRKKLTPSDVSGLNRLVIPKKYAVVHFPPVRNIHAQGISNKRQAVGIPIRLKDKGFKTWNFTYCFWKSNQSFVITKGWKEFVKEARLKPKDVVIFYGPREGKLASIIGVECNDSGTSGGLLGSHVGLQPDLQCDFEDQDGEDERGGNEMKKGFKLFGVEIKVGGGNGNGNGV
ncbi:hypothetical protein CsSME_00050052 [Camellia sinensis var. sinensis]